MQEADRVYTAGDETAENMSNTAAEILDRGKRISDAVHSSAKDAAIARARKEQDAKNRIPEAGIPTGSSKAGMMAKADAAGSAIVSAGKYTVSAAAPFLIGLAVVFLFVFGILLLVTLDADQTQQSTREGSFTGEIIADDIDAQIENTWTGVFYQKYSAMSVYAMVDMENIEKGNAEVCPAADGAGVPYGTNTDSCSGNTFDELTGTKFADIDQEHLYQQDTEEWNEMRIADIDGREKYLAVSAGAIYNLDSRLNDGIIYPQQFIRPVAADCTEDISAFLSDNSNDRNKDGRVTIEDCRIRNYDEAGNPAPTGIDAAEYLDNTLYLSSAQSQKFSNSEQADTDTGRSSAVKLDGKTEGQWDYGLGTLAHYKAYFQPSRIADYYVDQIDVICTGDGTAGNGFQLDACTEKKFGDIVTMTRQEDDLMSWMDTLKEVYRGGVCSDGENIMGCGGHLYVPDSVLYYRDWHEFYNTYAEHIEDIHDFVYRDTERTGEYPGAAIADQEDWLKEPAVSTGIPATEVKYVIDYALTYAGSVSYNIAQDWITQTSAEHTQEYSYKISRNFSGSNVEDTIQNQELTGHSNADSISEYEYDACLYYEGAMKQCGFGEEENLIWVEEDTRIEGEPFEDTRTVMNPECWIETEYYTYLPKAGCSEEQLYQQEKFMNDSQVHEVYIPAHYEDSNGNIYYEGEIISEEQLIENGISDQRTAYTWGEEVSGILSAHKKGELQTYAVYYTSSVPETEDIVGIDYLEQYISNYKAYIPDPEEDSKWSCYQSDDTIKTDQSGNLLYENMIDATPAALISGLEYDPENGTVRKGKDLPAEAFCYADQPSDSANSLYITTRPDLQYYSVAGKLGYVVTEDGSTMKEVDEIITNSIAASIDSAADNALARILSDRELMETIDKYSALYGIDPHLTAGIAAERTARTGQASGNITGMQAEELTAYNMGGRAPATETYGGSHLAEERQPASWGNILSWLKRLWGNSAAGNSGAVERGSLERIIFTEELLNHGGVLPENNEEMTAEAVSIKAAAMKLQNLLEKYKYNVPMAITAYELGEEYLNTVLTLYQRETGVAAEAAIANALDTAWMDYRKEVWENPGIYTYTDGGGNKAVWENNSYTLEKENGTKTFQGWNYAESVLSHINVNYIYYQKIDSRYDQDEETGDRLADAVQHTIGIWNTAELYNSNQKRNTTISGDNLGALARAWRRLTKDTGIISENDWKEITGNQYKYPVQVWSEKTDFELYPAERYYYVKSNLSGDEEEELIQKMMIFGTDAGMWEIDYTNTEYWRGHFANLMGSENARWKSAVDVEKVFGTKQDSETGQNKTIARYDISETKPQIIRPFGYITADDGNREYDDAVTYRIAEGSKAVLAPFQGIVTETGTTKEGMYVTMEVEDYSDHTYLLTAGGLAAVNVKRGDYINAPDIQIGEAVQSSEGDTEAYTFKIALSCEGEHLDFDEIYNSFPSYSIISLWNADNDKPVIGGFANGARDGGDGANEHPTGTPIEGGELWGLFDSGWLHTWDPRLPDYWATIQKVWEENATGGARTLARYNCTQFAWYRLFTETGITDLHGNGRAMANNLCREHSDQYYCMVDTPAPGAILSVGGGIYGHVFYVEKVEGDTMWVSDGNVYNGVGDGSRAFTGTDQTGMRINYPMSMSYFHRMYGYNGVFAIPR